MEKVTTFVNDYFRNSEKADKATYQILFRAISEQYPNIVLNRKSFTRNVASIEKLKGRAGIQIPTERLSKDHRSRLKDRFLQELIGLPRHNFESIGLAELFQHADKLETDPDLKVNEINHKILARHFRLKELKALAREPTRCVGARCVGARFVGSLLVGAP